jgi:hypothetical protein
VEASTTGDRGQPKRSVNHIHSDQAGKAALLVGLTGVCNQSAGSGMARRNVDDELASDVLVDIPRAHERRFGCSGKLLKPSRGSVEAMVRKARSGP